MRKFFGSALLPVVVIWIVAIVACITKTPSGPPGILLAVLMTGLYFLYLYDSKRIKDRNAELNRLADAEKIKMYCICSKEALDQMKGIRGKMITQGGHAYLHAFWDAEQRFPALAKAYRRTSHAYKITLVVPTENDLVTLMESYRDICGVSLVKDAGFTVFKNEDGSPKPTITYLGLGPITESMIKPDLAPRTGPKTLT